MFNPERMQAKNRRKAVPLQCTDCYPGGRGCFAPLSSPASAAPAMDQQKGRALKTSTLEKLPGRLSRQTTDGLEGRALLWTPEETGACMAQEDSKVGPIPHFQEARIMRYTWLPWFKLSDCTLVKHKFSYWKVSATM